MPKNQLSFQYKNDESEGATGLAGLPVYYELALTLGLVSAIEKHLHVRDKKGWSDVSVIMSLILLHLAGGDCVDDIKKLQSDTGLCRILLRACLHKKPRSYRRRIERQWERDRRRGKMEQVVPSPSSIFRYLAAFHEEEEEKRREDCKEQGVKAFIPKENEHLKAFHEINREFLASLQQREMVNTATLDMDATLVETSKESALYCYKHFKAYQPLNVYWFERDQVVFSQFRDGNVPAGYNQCPVFASAVNMLPDGVEKVFLRTDTAGYEWELLKYCAEGKNERFGVIDFAVGCDVTPDFKKAVSEVDSSDWKPLIRKEDGLEIDTGQQYAEVNFVPNAISNKKHGPEYRYLAIREPLAQLELPGTENQEELPFPTMEFNDVGRYKIFGVVTNRDLDGDELIWWHRQRCGKSEEAHAVMKSDLGGGKLPSSDFGENAVWWQIMLLAANLNSAMKQLVLGGNWVKKRMKAVRFWIINVCGRVVKHGRGLFIKICSENPSLDLLKQIRQRIQLLSLPPP